MNIYFDLETIPGQAPGLLAEFAAKVTAPAQYKKPDSIAEWLKENAESVAEQEWRKTSFDGAHGHICVIGYAFDDGEPVTLYSDAYGDPAAERDLLARFYAAIDDAVSRDLSGGTRSTVKPVFVGHNVIDFDLRFLFQRSVMLGVRPPACIPFDAKPWDGLVFDTMTGWAGMRNRVAMDKLCKVFGFDEKGSEIEDEIDGSKVWDFVKAGRIADVAKYCAGDVVRTRQIYKRLTFSA